jgi:hypothetical protein
MMEREKLTGEIEVGQQFIWEPETPHAKALVTVTRVQDIHGDERRIWTRDEAGNETWNDESRFREACIRRAAVLNRPQGPEGDE